MPALPLAFVAFLPLLRYLDAASTGRRALLGGVVFGLTCFLPFCSFLWPLSEVSSFWWLVYLYCVLNSAFYPVLCAWATWRLRRSTSLPFSLYFPSLYLLFELLRNRTDLGFPVDRLANSLTAFPSWIQFAEWTGAFGVSFWILLVGSLVYDGWRAWSAGRVRLGGVLAAASLLLLLAGPLSGRILLARSEEPGRTIAVALIQPDITAERKAGWSDRDDPEGSAELRAEDLADLVRLGREAASRGVDLLVYPEGSRPGGVFHAPELERADALERRGFAEREVERVNQLLVSSSPPEAPLNAAPVTAGGAGPRDPVMQALSSELGLPVLYGAEVVISRDRRLVPLLDYDTHNGAVVARPGVDEIDWSAKLHLVPFTETFPFARLLGLHGQGGLARMRRMVLSLGGGFSPGEPRTMETGIGRVGVMVCYESVYSDVSRFFQRDGAELLVTITNDRWFGRTSFGAWHARAVVLRAIETRLPVVRAANSGVSCLVDDRGGLHQANGVLSGVEIITGRVASRPRSTFYTRHGDWPLLLAGLLVLGTVVQAFRARSRAEVDRRSGGSR